MKPVLQSIRLVLPPAPKDYDPKEQNQLRRLIAEALERSAGTSSAYGLSRRGLLQCYLTLDAADNPIFLDADGETVIANMAAFIAIKAVQQSSTGTQIVVRVTVTDFLDQGGSYLVITPNAVGCTITPNTASSALASGGFVDYTITRPSAGSGPGRVIFVATDTNGQRLTNFDVVDVPPADVIVANTVFAVTPGTTSYAISWTTDGTVTYQVDGGGYSAASSPLTVNRNSIGGADKVVTLKSVLNGQTTYNSITVPAQVLGTVSLSVSRPARVDNNDFTVTWSVSGMPSGTTYNIVWSVDNVESGNQDGATSPQNIATTNSIGATPSGTATVNAIYNGTVIATGSRGGAFTI